MPRPIIAPDSLFNWYANGRALGFQFTIYSNYYRNAPVSGLEKLVLKVDGKVIDPLYIHFCVNGKKFQPSELPLMFNEYWGMRTPAYIEVDQFDGLAPGPHEIDLTLLRHVGYIETPLCVIDNENTPHMYPTQNIGDKVTIWLQK